MSFEPKPVNFALNRDMLGKILSHAREDMSKEVNKMMFHTKGDPLTLEQAREFLSTLYMRVCSEPGCICIGDCGAYDFFDCSMCQLRVCYTHTWYNQGGTYERTCSGCRPNTCECGKVITYNGDRISYHACDRAKDRNI
jgi:hypothetical protein